MEYTLGGNLTKIYSISSVDEVDIETMHGILVALAYIVVCTALSWIIVKKRDVA